MALSTSKALKLCAAGVVFAALSGCADYLNNWDTVSFRTGDSTDANTAIQAIDPRPDSAYVTVVGNGG